MTERRTAKRNSLSEILVNMQETADGLHDGNLTDNALKIFNLLSTSDRKTFLRKAIFLLKAHDESCRQDGHILVCIPDPDKEDLTIKSSEVESERKKIDDLNAGENLKLRTWLIKIFFLISIFGTIMVIFFGFIYGNPSESASDALSNLNKVFSILF